MQWQSLLVVRLVPVISESIPGSQHCSSYTVTREHVAVLLHHLGSYAIIDEHATAVDVVAGEQQPQVQQKAMQSSCRWTYARSMSVEGL